MSAVELWNDAAIWKTEQSFPVQNRIKVMEDNIENKKGRTHYTLHHVRLPKEFANVS